MTSIQRAFSSLQQQAAAAGLAAVTTVAVLAAMVQLADGYQAQAQLAQQATEPAVQQVVIVGQRSARG